MEKTCPICGYNKLSEPPYRDYTGGGPSFEVCLCCEFEFGFDDLSKGYTFDRYRDNWIKNGFIFFYKELMPQNWNEETMKKQLENIDGLQYTPRI